MASSTVPIALPATTTGAGVGQQPPPQGAAPQQPPVQRLIDPAQGAFIGGDPTTNIDVPVTFLFLLLFAAGAYTHIRIYRANAKRGHKFLLSDLMFDFCMVRSVTCIMRIVWAFEKDRVVILIALIVQFGGIIRSIHPNFGWHPAVRVFTLFFLFSVPAVIVLNSTSIGVSFYKIEDQDRVDTALNLLKAGISWIMLLAALPVIAVVSASIIPGPRPERFGQGDTHQKIAVLLVGATLLIAGHAVRLAATVLGDPPTTTNVIYSKELFYTSGFMLEIFVVVFYAVVRVDLLFHVPNGSKGPGDYSRKPKPGEEDYEAALLTKEEIEDELIGLGHPYEIVDSSGLGRDGSGRTIVAFSTRRMNGEKPVVLPPRPEAYSRVMSIRGSVRSMRGSLRSARGGLSRMMSTRMTSVPYLNEVEVGHPEIRENPFGTPPVSQYGVAQPLFIQSRFSRYTDPEDETTQLRPESQATSGEIPLSLDREGLGPYEGRPLARRSSVQKFTILEREGGPLK
ncbi:uncharacterized protein ColSpa_06791 [Colletotrichum spaethianum]|uniref:Uncharacterized protein n=1 Tax=Colletotrichum spaethianum TaxID=700344 RepID=A0AA37P1D5_9PEZI|nr:uncharacterized protein ColSpa_06791 [Colletotrichum spaethianum]GKT46610.1 hypothetical protein ColSpa_06791 [Colletotrichum spaethianum]